MYTERWRIEWKSDEGHHYMLKILDKDYAGNSTTLTGGDNPFVTQEDSGSDTFKPVRGQTGYVRVVTDDPTLMESLAPANNTQRQVQVWELTNSEDILVWIGFLQADVYTQSWNGETKEIEIAVNSVLQTLQSVNLRSDMSYGREPLKRLVSLANELIDPDFPVVTNVYNIDNAQEQYNWLTWIVDWHTFFMNQSDEEQSDDAQIINTDTYHYGCSLYEALEKVCQLAGLTLQERGRSWFFTKIDLDQETCRCQYWNIDPNDLISNPSSISLNDLLNTVEWYGTDNKADYANGRRMVIVSTDIVSHDEVIKQPEVVPNDTAPYQFNTGDVQGGFRFFAQVADSENQQDETFYNHHYVYRQLDDSTPTTRQDVVDCSVIGTRGTAAFFQDNQRTGCFHIRYAKRRNETDAVYLGSNALVLRSQYMDRGGDWGLPIGRAAYRLKSRSGMYFKGGWLRLNYNVETFIPTNDANHVELGPFPTHTVKMYWLIRVGNYLWSPTNLQWDYIPSETTEDVRTHQIEVTLRDGKIVTNKTEEMKIDENDGFFIPLNNTVLEGEVSITILDAVVVTTSYGLYEPCSTHLIEGLELTYEQEQSLTYSKKNENRYKKHILSVGFKDNEEVQLTIGTFNNNKQAVNLIRYIDGSYIEGVPYFVDAVNTETLRPELHLLNMMYDHYKEVRRIYTGVLKSRSWLPAERWMYGGRKFLAIISRRNWRTDTDDVKFLET